jgi:hypothetical protein
MNCIGCNESQKIYKTGGNNNIISLILIKYNLKQLNCFMLIILTILKREKIHEFELNQLNQFSLIENGYEMNFENYLELKINEIDLFHNNLEYGFIDKDLKTQENEYIFLLKSLFIISLIYDKRIKLFIFGDHTKLLPITSESISSKIDINLFFLKCNELINDFKNKIKQLYDIGYYITIEWVCIGLYIF